MTPDQAALVQKAQESLEAARLLAGKGFTSFAASRACILVHLRVRSILFDFYPNIC